MPTINKLTATDTLAAGDQVAVFTQNSGDTRKASMTLIAQTVDTLTTTEFPQYTRQGASPSVSPFTVAITDSNANIHLILTPSGALAVGTITLPAIANVIDKQEVLVNSTQTVTTFTVAGNGAGSVIGAPTTLAVNDFFRMRFDETTDAWYRVG